MDTHHLWMAFSTMGTSTYNFGGILANPLLTNCVYYSKALNVQGCLLQSSSATSNTLGYHNFRKNMKPPSPAVFHGMVCIVEGLRYAEFFDMNPPNISQNLVTPVVVFMQGPACPFT